MRRRGVLLPILGAFLAVSGCSRSNNLLFGRVEAKVGSHVVAVTDCYRLHVPPPEQIKGTTTYHYMPCRDADVWIRGEQLVVNGQEYGRLALDDSVTVDHGVVLVNGRAERQSFARKAVDRDRRK